MDWQATFGDWLDTDWIVWFLVPAIGAIALALLAWRADRRRMRRSDPDAVGWIAWRDVAFWSTGAAVLLLGAAIRGWLAA